VVWAKDKFVAVGVGVTFFSSDGMKWERSANENAPNSVAYGAGVFVGPRWKGRLMQSIDGIKWSEVHKADYHIEAVTFGELA
jgi:hypothetical protein